MQKFVLDTCKIQDVVSAWSQFLYSVNWQDLIQNIQPIHGPCGIVYDLPNLLQRPNEGLAIVDMRTILYTEPHYHPDLEIYFVLKGQAQVIVGHEIRNIKQGDAVVLPPFKAHYAIPNDECIIACVNVPPYIPESYIALKKSDRSVDFDYDLFKARSLMLP